MAKNNQILHRKTQIKCQIREKNNLARALRSAGLITEDQELPLAATSTHDYLWEDPDHTESSADSSPGSESVSSDDSDALSTSTEGCADADDEMPDLHCRIAPFASYFSTNTVALAGRATPSRSLADANMSTRVFPSIRLSSPSKFTYMLELWRESPLNLPTAVSLRLLGLGIGPDMGNPLDKKLLIYLVYLPKKPWDAPETA
ncbi:hypothetical protein GGX14DRAFT_397912 [Mycena pura]|uniref:Uncharacterized protein n=1 Tax=Mycena pura TaxID=153505 RepID=A0AAD6VEN0_9AGAR|nr:hypothetical protein GGX14DRAFT_397912 [Mycena pura]